MKSQKGDQHSGRHRVINLIANYTSSVNENGGYKQNYVKNVNGS